MRALLVAVALTGCASAPRNDTQHFQNLGRLRGVVLATPNAIEAMSDGIDDLGRPMALTGTRAAVVTLGGYIYAPDTKTWRTVAHELCHADGQDPGLCHSLSGGVTK